VREDPDDFAALYRRGRCHEEQGDFPAAKEDYSRALGLNPGTGFVEEALEKIERGWADAEERAELPRARRREEERRAQEAEARRRARERRAAPERPRAEDLARIEVMTSFGVAYDFGVAAGRGRPDYDLADHPFGGCAAARPSRRVSSVGSPSGLSFEGPGPVGPGRGSVL
jgi:tetratricopeptide (TPR) repeat protein